MPKISNRKVWMGLMISLAPSMALGVQVAENGKPMCTVVRAVDATPAEMYAVKELTDYLKQITGAALAVTTEAHPICGPRVIVGPGSLSRSVLGDATVAHLGPDEFVVRTVGQDLLLVGGRPRGTLYAVYYLLDDFLGVRWWAPDATFIPHKPSLTIGELNVTQKPAFDYRCPWHLCALDPDWSTRNKCNGEVQFRRNGAILIESPDAKHGGSRLVYPVGKNCHTFDHYVPASLLAKHPDWFSEVNGKRVAGQCQGQLCLANPAVLDYLVEQVRADLKRDPRITSVSVTQNDNQFYCRCPKCRAIDEEEGSPSGTMVRFVNAAASRLEKEYPHLLVDTFAYQYTRKPPKHVRPRQNVVIRLCSIECSFAQPLDHPVNKAFLDDLKGWSSLTDKLYVWDYIANFSCLWRPFPNLRVLAPNLRLIAKYHATSVLEQGVYQAPSEFAELRSWMLSRLLWNPGQDDQALVKEFVKGYYGAAAPFIHAYINLIHSPLVHSDHSMGCFDGGPAPFLNAKVMAKAEHLFQQAESATANDPAVLVRVRREHLSVQCMWLMNYRDWVPEARAKAYPVPPPIQDLMMTFTARAKEVGATHFSDGQLMPVFLAGLAKRLNAPPARASGTWGADVPENAFDGDATTGWSAGGFGPHWIQEDLGKVKAVKTISSEFGSQYTTVAYKIDGSLDGEVWKPIVPVTNLNTFKRTDHLPMPIAVRYLRTTILQASSSLHAREWIGMVEQRIETKEIPKMKASKQ